MDSGRPGLGRIFFSIIVSSMFLLVVLSPALSGMSVDTGSPTAQPPLPGLLVNSTKEIENIILRIDEDLMSRHVQVLQDFKTRYSYRGDKCDLAASYIHDIFQRNGLNATYDPFTYRGWTMTNVIGEKPGAATSDGTVIICAHYDSTSSKAWAEAPGADDNGSGTAAVLAAAELLSDYEFNQTIRFIAFSGEEQGLKGSTHYANDAVARGDNITGVINLDMIAYNPDPGSNEVYLVRDYNEDFAIADELVYGPAPAGDTTVYFWLDNTGINDCTLYIEPQGSPGTLIKLTESTDYTLNYSTGFIDLSPHGPLMEYENLTAWYNYSVSGQLVDNIKETMQKYRHIANITPVDHKSGSSDHAPFSPSYPAIMFIERRYSSNPHYHSTHDLARYLNFTYCANVTQLAIASLASLAGINSTDTAPPAHSAGFPPHGGYGQEYPEISIDITDASPLNASSIRMYVDGALVAHSESAIPLGSNISYIPTSPFADGQVVNVTVAANDTAGNGFNHSWEFEVDAVQPLPPSNITLSSTKILFEKQGLAIDIGPSAYDSKNAFAPSVIKHDGEYKMWYAGFDNVNYQICYANSSDGITWTKSGVVLSYGTTGDADRVHACYPSVMYDGEYKMWYSGYDGSNWRILYANSSDGLNWTKQGLCLALGTEGMPDQVHALMPKVIKNEIYEMWYTGHSGIKYNILYANSTNGIDWIKSNVPVDLLGTGQMYGDAIVAYPEVRYQYEQYHMWYSRYDGYFMRTIYAVSPDGQNWKDMGLAIDVSDTGYDSRRANLCSIMFEGNETRTWYSAYNNQNWRIMYANISPHMPLSDLVIDWTPSPSDDILRYEIYRETRPSAFTGTYETVRPEFYQMPDGMSPWVKKDYHAQNISVFGPVSGSSPSFFLLPEDAIVDLSLFLQTDTGGWQKLVQGTDYELIAGLGMVDYSPIYPLSVDSAFYASYNHSASRALRITGNAIVESGILDSPKSYYYKIRAVDKVGHVTQLSPIQGTVGIEAQSGWTLVSSPFMVTETPLDQALQTLQWNAARTWNSSNHWTLNRTTLPYSLNTLESVGKQGIWIQSPGGNFSSFGIVQNLSISLSAGWNLVCYPYHEIKSVDQALAGLPWDMVEALDTTSPYLISQMDAHQPLFPGQGFWLHLTSDAQWTAINV